jgi:hypothetical protein
MTDLATRIVYMVRVVDCKEEIEWLIHSRRKQSIPCLNKTEERAADNEAIRLSTYAILCAKWAGTKPE